MSQQLVQAFPWDTAPRYRVRDRDGIYGERVRRQLKDMAVKEILTNHDSRCHLSLAKDSPETREVQPPDKGIVVEIPKVGGLHHRYERRAA